MGKTRFHMPAVGGSSLFILFAILCLTVFAVLSVATVQANARLTKASVDAVSRYYEADSEAERTIARLRRGEDVPGVAVGDGICSFACPISDSQELAVSVRIRGDDYSILHWQVVRTTEHRENDDMIVWGGEALPDSNLP